MAVAQNKYYPKQMNGPVISAFGEARDNEYGDSEAVINYLYNLSINTAQETELENIGRIIGYIRPLVPEGFNDENIFLFGSVPLETDDLIGLADTGGQVGGRLSASEKTETGFMNLGLYRKLLEAVAVLQRYGITIRACDKIASIFSRNYEIQWDTNKDVVIKFNDAIGYKNIWVLTQIFYRMATAPQVVISSNV